MDYDWPLLVIFVVGVLFIALVLRALQSAFELLVESYLRLRIFRYSRRLNVWKSNVNTAGTGTDRA